MQPHFNTQPQSPFHARLQIKKQKLSTGSVFWCPSKSISFKLNSFELHWPRNYIMSNTMTAHEPINYLDSILNEEEKRCEYSHQWRNFTISRSGRFKSKNKHRNVVDGKMFDRTSSTAAATSSSSSLSHSSSSPSGNTISSSSSYDKDKKVNYKTNWFKKPTPI